MHTPSSGMNSKYARFFFFLILETCEHQQQEADVCRVTSFIMTNVAATITKLALSIGNSLCNSTFHHSARSHVC